MHVMCYYLSWYIYPLYDHFYPTMGIVDDEYYYDKCLQQWIIVYTCNLLQKYDRWGCYFLGRVELAGRWRCVVLFPRETWALYYTAGYYPDGGELLTMF